MFILFEKLKIVLFDSPKKCQEIEKKIIVFIKKKIKFGCYL